MWDLSSLTRDRNSTHSALEAQNLNHWITREVPVVPLKKKKSHFIFGFAGSQLLCAGFSLVVASGGYSLWPGARFSLQ